MRDVTVVIAQLALGAIVGAAVGIPWVLLGPGLVMIAAFHLVWRYPWPPASQRWVRLTVLLRRRLPLVLFATFPVFAAFLWGGSPTIAGVLWGSALGFVMVAGFMMSAAVCPRCRGRYFARGGNPQWWSAGRCTHCGLSPEDSTEWLAVRRTASLVKSSDTK
jgi:hypothetical protein